MKKICYMKFKVRILLLISVLFVSVGMWGEGFIPTDGGQVVNLKQGQQILLSTIVNGEEYFVCHYPGYTGGYFSYTNWDSEKGNFLKLVPQDAGATEPATPSICPLTKLRAALRFNTVSYRNNNIKIIESHFIQPFSVLRYDCKFCNCTFFLEFTLGIDIADMTRNNRFIPLEKQSHLVLCEDDVLANLRELFAA